MTALLASKGQQLWMRPNVGLPAVQFHGPLAQFAAGWCKACFRGSSHFLSLDLDSLIAIMGVNWLRTNCKLPSGIAVILQLIQRVLLGAVRGNAASPVPAHLGAENAEAVLGIVVGDALDKARQNFLS
jgi:hypothetical protein